MSRESPRLYDISPLIDANLAVWPGDTPFEATDLLRLERGDPVHLSTVRLSCHTGAHADAPSHFVAGAASIDGVPLDPYLGPCLLVEVRRPPGTLLEPGDLEPGVWEELGPEPEGCPRILLRTGCWTDRSVFPKHFPALSPGLVEALGLRGVRLVGTDAPSVDPFESKDLPAHHALAQAGIVNLESLWLVSVPTGRYWLAALPLRLAGRDASPVRAVLRELG